MMPKGMSDVVRNVIKDSDGRYIKLEINMNETIVTVCAIYAPNIDRPSFLPIY